MGKYIYGPVPSRRLGRSLGVDLVPFKTCTFDCIYCQLGQTTHKTCERREWFPMQDVLEELGRRLDSRPDYITLGGSGEPTLFSRIGELIVSIKEMTDIPLAVLTNGSLLWREEIRAQLKDADLIMPSLDAGDDRMFRLVNRPHEEISFEKMVRGLVDFRRQYSGQYWLEIFLLENLTAEESEVKKIARRAKLIEPDRVDLNTVVRPPSENGAIGVTRDRMTELASIFDPPAEVIAEFAGVSDKKEFLTDSEEVYRMLMRRPCSVKDVADGLGMHRAEAIKHLEKLVFERRVEKASIAGNTYYKIL